MNQTSPARAWPFRLPRALFRRGLLLLGAVALLLGICDVRVVGDLAAVGSEVPSAYEDLPDSEGHIVAEVVESAEAEAEADDLDVHPPRAVGASYPVEILALCRQRIPRANRARGPPAVDRMALHLESPRTPRGPPCA